MHHNTLNFNVNEFNCKCGCAFNIIDQRIIDMAQTIREALGVPVRVNSGCRCDKHNAKVGGVKNSKHTKGLAADLSCSLGSQKLFDTVKKLHSEGKLQDLDYCIRYRWGIHIDCGGKRNSLWEVRA